jgi:hypothetical protein
VLPRGHQGERCRVRDRAPVPEPLPWGLELHDPASPLVNVIY